MPPTPPPTSTHHHHHTRELLDSSLPDARHYQPLPDSPASPPSPLPRGNEQQDQQLHQQRQLFTSLGAEGENALNSQSRSSPPPVTPKSATPGLETSPAVTTSETAEAAATGNQNHSGSDLLVPEDDDSHHHNPSSPATPRAGSTTTPVVGATLPPVRIIPSSDIIEQGDSANTGFYDLSAIRNAGLYRRSGTLETRGNRQVSPIVRREIGIVKRDGAGVYVGRQGENIASTTLGSGRLKNAELAGRYAQTRSPPQHPTSAIFRASPVHSHSSNQSEEEGEEGEEEEENSGEEEEEEEDEEDMEEEESWIGSFCSMLGHEYFAEVNEEFIDDDFNLTGLGQMVPMYKEALEMILDVEPEDDSDSQASASESLSEQPGQAYRRRTSHMRVASDLSVIETSAELLYGLIHQRFITSRQGIQIMYEKYLANHFGFCPRVYCNQARVLPCGYSDTPGVETVKLFCPSCCDIYVPPNSRFQTVDGAYFGTTFASLFLMTFPELDTSGTGRKETLSGSTLNSSGGKKGVDRSNIPMINGVLASNLAPGLAKGKQYEMRIYGFRVSERARSGPRMGWLRSRPEDVSVLDETAKFGAPGGDDLGYSSDDEAGLEGSEEESEGEIEMAMGGDSVPIAPSRRGTGRGGVGAINTNGAGTNVTSITGGGIAR